MKKTLSLLILAGAMASLLVSCTGKSTVPSTKKEIMDSFVAGTLDPSYAPAAFFIHFGADQKLGDPAVFPRIGNGHPEGPVRTDRSADHGPREL